MRGTCAPPTVTGTRQATGSATSVSVASGKWSLDPFPFSLLDAPKARLENFSARPSGAASQPAAASSCPVAAVVPGTFTRRRSPELHENNRQAPPIPSAGALTVLPWCRAKAYATRRNTLCWKHPRSFRQSDATNATRCNTKSKKRARVWRSRQRPVAASATPFYEAEGPGRIPTAHGNEKGRHPGNFRKTQPESGVLAAFSRAAQQMQPNATRQRKNDKRSSPSAGVLSAFIGVHRRPICLLRSEPNSTALQAM